MQKVSKMLAATETTQGGGGEGRGVGWGGGHVSEPCAIISSFLLLLLQESCCMRVVCGHAALKKIPIIRCRRNRL